MDLFDIQAEPQGVLDPWSQYMTLIGR